MNKSLIESFAGEMIGIFRDHYLKRKTTTNIDALTIHEAYAVQERFLSKRITAGERPIGYKIGCTSPAIRAQMGLSEPICGRLLAPYIYPDGQNLEIERFVDCSLEPELVLYIGKDIDATNLEASNLRSAISGVSPGIEIHNYRFWYGRPTLQELIASNGVHAALVVGPKRELPADLDLGSEHISLWVRNTEVACGIGRDVMGDPLNSLRWLLTHLGKRGQQLSAGDVVIPGSATRLIPVRNGDVAEARFSHFGSCRVVF